MKTKKNTLTVRLVFLTVVLISKVFFLSAQSITTTLQSCSFTANTLDFDIIITNVTNNSANNFILQSGAYGVDFNHPGIYNGGTISIAFLPGTSQLNSTQSNFDSINTFVSNVTNSIRINAQVVLNSNNGTPMPPGVPIKVGSFRLTNTVNWTADSLAEFSFVLAQTMNKTRTKYTIYLNGSSIALPFNGSISTVSVSQSCQSMVLNPTPFTANIAQSDTVICINDCINFFGNANEPVTSWNWLFPGGTPATSTLQNPIVCYSLPGNYFASLIVTNASSVDTAVMINPIIVKTIPTVTITASDTVCLTGGLVTLNGMPAGGIYSGTGVTATNFNPLVAGIGNHSVLYNYTDASGCSNSDSALINVDLFSFERSSKINFISLVRTKSSFFCKITTSTSSELKLSGSFIFNLLFFTFTVCRIASIIFYFIR